MSAVRRLLFLALLFLNVPPVGAQPRLPKPLHDAVTTGLDLILRQEYDQAETHFTALSSEQPRHPAGPLFHAAVLQARSLDWGTILEQKQFDSLLTEAFRRITHLTDGGASTQWNTFFAATAEGYDAVASVERGDWFGGIRKGISSAAQFEELLDADSTFTDAGVGLGAYLYWRSRKTEFLHWLPFVADDRPRGIRLLVEGADRGMYNRHAAISALISIALDASEYAEAERWSNRGLQDYPENRVFLWGKATALDRAGHCQKAIPAYEELLHSILRSATPVPYDQIVCRLNLAKCLVTAGDAQRAIPHLEANLNLESTRFPESLRDRATAKYEETRALLDKIALSLRTSP
jgi:tetratricopeptide (TPR) repeat protein